MSTAFAKFVTGSLGSEHFTFVDIGCSGGLDPAWRVFEDRLRAIGFDASVEECERLAKSETHPNVRYVAGFVGLQEDHPFAKAHAAAGKPHGRRNPFPRLSASRAMELQRARLEDATLEEKLEHNAWGMTRLADPNKPVIVPHVLQEMGWADVDFLKIDIDGPDFLVLNSFEGQFDRLGLLAARLEVNLTGASDPTENVFHNTDRFMRERGFELFALDVRLYSLHALPAPFAITAPAQTRTGRPFQAEAFYARDPAGPDWADFGAGMSVEKLLKLAAIFSVWNEPDSAAEILIRFRDRLQGVFDVDAGLDLLAAQAQPDIEQPLSYKDYIASFEANAPQFYPPVPRAPSPPTLKQRLSASFRAFLNPADRPNG